MKHALPAISLVLLAVCQANAQPAEATARFGVADVHGSPHSSSPLSQMMRVGFYRGGRYEIKSATMVDLISSAYGVDPDKVLSGPNWLELDRFDILATAPAGASPEALKTMLQALLADRFQLKVHIDKKEFPTYALILGKKQQLRESDGSGETGCQFEIQGMPNGRGGPPGDPAAPPASPTLAFKCGNMTMAAFADFLHTMPLAQQLIGANPLVDQTGLKGAWNFEFHYVLPFNLNGSAAPVAGNVIMEALDKQLGLKLKSRKLALPVIVVESANEKPADNLPGIAEKLPVAPTEFEVADIKPTDPKAEVTGAGRGGGFLPGGRLDLHGITLQNLIVVAWDTLPQLVVGGPKFLDTDKFDVVAKAPASTLTGASPNMMAGPRGQPPVDIDALRLMLKALIVDRFKIESHFEDRPMDAYTLVAAKPKLRKADPANRTGFHEGPGPDGKDPRQSTPALSRLVTCTNMTMAQLAEALPGIAGGYFQTVSRTVLDSTGLEGAYDFTLSFSGAGMAGGGGGRGGSDARPQSGAPGGDASDPNGAITLAEAMEKQIGIKLITVKRPVPVLVIDKIQQKPTAN